MTLGPVCGPVSPAEKTSGGWDRTSDLGLMNCTFRDFLSIGAT